MSENIQMRTDVVCGRCGTKTEITVTADKLQDLFEQSQKKRDTVAAIQKLTEQIPVDSGPEIIIFIREDTKYDVEILDNLCVKTSSKRNRGCSARVKDLIKEILKLEVKPKKPKTVAKNKKPKNGSTGATNLPPE